MRTNIEIDDELMAEAMKAGGYTTKREAVEAGLRMLSQRRKAYKDLLALKGKVDWIGDLHAERQDIAAEPRTAYKAARPVAARPPRRRA